LLIVVAFGLCVIGLCMYGTSLVDPTYEVRHWCPDLIRVDQWGVAVHMVSILFFVGSLYLWQKSDGAKGWKLTIGCLVVVAAVSFGVMAVLVRVVVDFMMRSWLCRLAMADVAMADVKDGELPPNSRADLIDLGRLLSDMGIVCSVGYVLCICAVLLRWCPLRPEINGH
jgi:hypothetical protein